MRPYVVYQSGKRLPCAFYSMVIKNSALEAKYTNGLKGFLGNGEKARTNRHLTVTCYPDACDTVEREQDLIGHGLTKGNDYTIFEADNYSSALGSCPGKREIPLDVDMDIPWLRGRYTDWGVDVWYAGAEDAPRRNGDRTSHRSIGLSA